MPFYSYLEWYEVFRKSGMKIMPHPYTMTNKPDTTQNRNPKVHPQNATVYGRVVHLTGQKEFQNKSFNTLFNLGDFASNRNYVEMRMRLEKLRTIKCRTWIVLQLLTTEKLNYYHRTVCQHFEQC